MFKGFLQGRALNTFAPVEDFNAFRIALSLAVQRGIKIHRLDIRTAFLHGDIDDDLYVSPPHRLPFWVPNEALKVADGVYGLKRASRLSK